MMGTAEEQEKGCWFLRGHKFPWAEQRGTKRPFPTVLLRWPSFMPSPHIQSAAPKAVPLCLWSLHLETNEHSDKTHTAVSWGWEVLLGSRSRFPKAFCDTYPEQPHWTKICSENLGACTGW